MTTSTTSLQSLGLLTIRVALGVAATGAGRLSLDGALKLPERVTGGGRTTASPTA